MDDQLLDAICECLVSSSSTEGTIIVREGNPVTEMFFLIRGRLESSTTNEGRTIMPRPGDFCREELLAWALLPKSTTKLPSLTRTVHPLVEVEAFAMRVEDLKFAAWQRYKRKRLTKCLTAIESFAEKGTRQEKEQYGSPASSSSSQTKLNLGFTILADASSSAVASTGGKNTQIPKRTK
ncbi:hypothetical protein Vadar_013228 [Vaccinium darrowii]|uniref:Uncharacterized protein n=1 Tax=Vaccinium darrowii TaxID=229202 RepID=A0ACB7Z3I9_9ERIC|nr:hypothetical protein Vadar_013228 [Vaccinium darrowii]